MSISLRGGWHGIETMVPIILGLHLFIAPVELSVRCLPSRFTLAKLPFGSTNFDGLAQALFPGSSVRLIKPS
eukprot:m.459985 g.459985  ORF g.459985 m.459985 type:complete len:72 (+) comp21887_c0_seq1:732-947(+)